MFYALNYDTSTGIPFGTHAYAEQPATLPAGEITCTEAQAQDPMAWKVVNGAVVANTAGALKRDAKVALAATDTTMLRIAEAVALGKTTWTTADVVAWAAYRAALRAIQAGTDTTSTALPAKPAYPANT